MEFYAVERAIVNSLRVKNWIICELEASLVLFYTGVSRESAKIIAERSSNIRSGASDALEAMHAIKNEALVIENDAVPQMFAAAATMLTAAYHAKSEVTLVIPLGQPAGVPPKISGVLIPALP